MDIDSPDDYEPPPDRIPDRAPERAPVDTRTARRCDRATASRSKTGTGSTTTRSSAPPTPGIRQSSASETAGRSTNSAGPPTPGTTPADQPAPRLLARRNHPVGTGIGPGCVNGSTSGSKRTDRPLCAVTSADTQQPGIVHIGGSGRLYLPPAAAIVPRRTPSSGTIARLTRYSRIVPVDAKYHVAVQSILEFLGCGGAANGGTGRRPSRARHKQALGNVTDDTIMESADPPGARGKP